MVLSPLPPREGISATCLRAPGGRQTHIKADWLVPASIGQWLAEEFPGATPEAREVLLHEGQMCDQFGRPVSAEDRVIPGGFYFYHRPVPQEKRVPFEVSILYEDADLVVVDKPHFLASTPNGRFIRECVVTRLRVALDEPELVAIHRLDRVTAGVLVLSRRRETRGKYQVLFERREVTKKYRALAWLPESFAAEEMRRVNAQRQTRLYKEPGQTRVLEVPGKPNAHTSIEFLDSRGVIHGNPVGEFSLVPHTGKTHQLRVHMNALGMPLVNDGLYPVDKQSDPYDFSSPLQLVAQELGFRDPCTGHLRKWTSQRRLMTE